MTRTPLLLLGAGGHARSCIDVIEAQAVYSVAGLTDPATKAGEKVLGLYPVLGTDDDLPALLKQYRHALVTVGQIASPAVRIRLFEAIAGCGAESPVIVSPRAHVSRHASVGAGTIVMHGAIVNAGARIGKNCIINSNALIEHDAIIGDHCHISTGALVNGHVKVGARTFVGSNACIRQEAEIGDDCIIGMGQNVYGNCGPGTRLARSKAAS
jgi:sugar O-acyltransferase (sialic acid O-acetyltransferase NeuD family)